MRKAILLLVLTSTMCSDSKAQLNSRIKGHFDDQSTDTLSFFLIENSIIGKRQSFRIGLKDKRFDTTITLDMPVRFLMNDGRNLLTGIMEPGDTIDIQGKGSDPKNWISDNKKGNFTTLTLLYEFNKTLQGGGPVNLKATIALAKKTIDPFDYLFRFADSSEGFLLDRLNKDKAELSPIVYNRIFADIKSRFMLLRYNIPTYVYNEPHFETLKKHAKELSSKTISYINDRLKFDANLSYSDSYAESVYIILFKEYSAMTMENNSHMLNNKYHFLDSILPEKLKRPVLSLFIESDMAKLNQGEDLESIISKFFPAEDQNIYSVYVNSRVNSLFKKDSPAPEFEIENTAGKLVHLKDFTNKVILVDFWYKACVPCHALFSKTRPVREHFSNNKNVVFLNVSIDDSKTWRSALKEFDIPGYHAFTQNLREAHPMIKQYKVAGYPTTTLIGKRGQIAVATPSDNPEELIAQIESVLKEP